MYILLYLNFKSIFYIKLFTFTSYLRSLVSSGSKRTHTDSDRGRLLPSCFPNKERTSLLRVRRTHSLSEKSSGLLILDLLDQKPTWYGSRNILADLRNELLCHRVGKIWFVNFLFLLSKLKTTVQIVK